MASKIKPNEARDSQITWELEDDGTITAKSESIPDWSFHVHRPAQWASHQPGENLRYYPTLQAVVDDVEAKHTEAQAGAGSDTDIEEILAVLGSDEGEGGMGG